MSGCQPLQSPCSTVPWVWSLSAKSCWQSGERGSETQKAFSYKSINLYSHPNGLGTSNTATLSCKEGWEMEPLFWYPIQHRGSMTIEKEVQVSSVQSLSCVRLFATPWIAARQASLSIANSRSPPKPMSIESVMPSNHLILCRLLLLLPSIFLSIRVFSNESALHIRWPKYREFQLQHQSYQCYWVGIKVTALILYIKTFCPTWKCTVFLLI